MVLYSLARVKSFTSKVLLSIVNPPLALFTLYLLDSTLLYSLLSTLELEQYAVLVQTACGQTP